MKQELKVNDLKQIEVKILNVLDDYCKNNGLKYYLAYGTLIGAIRHKGFIPWDDDIDVIMPRADYEKILGSFNKSNKYTDICLLSHSIDENYYLPIAKLVDTKTVLKEDVSFHYEMGVYIDIFPLENLTNSLNEARARIKHSFRYNQELQLKTMKWRAGRSLFKNLVLMGGKAALVCKSASKIIEDLESFCCETKSETFTKYVGVMSGMSQGDDSRILEKEWFEKIMMVEFEGKEYPAPIGADAFLRKLYGNYMQLPPEDQRVSHHSFEAWVKE